MDFHSIQLIVNSSSGSSCMYIGSPLMIGYFLWACFKLSMCLQSSLVNRFIWRHMYIQSYAFGRIIFQHALNDQMLARLIVISEPQTWKEIRGFFWTRSVCNLWNHLLPERRPLKTAADKTLIQKTRPWPLVRKIPLRPLLLSAG